MEIYRNGWMLSKLRCIGLCPVLTGIWFFRNISIISGITAIQVRIYGLYLCFSSILGLLNMHFDNVRTLSVWFFAWRTLWSDFNAIVKWYMLSLYLSLALVISALLFIKKFPSGTYEHIVLYLLMFSPTTLQCKPVFLEWLRLVVYKDKGTKEKLIWRQYILLVWKCCDSSSVYLFRLKIQNFWIDKKYHLDFPSI